jgi:hypothetical protein
LHQLTSGVLTSTSQVSDRPQPHCPRATPTLPSSSPLTP